MDSSTSDEDRTDVFYDIIEHQPRTMSTPTARTVKDYEEDECFQRVSQLCLPFWDDRGKTSTVWPERPEYTLSKRLPHNAKWTRAVRYIYDAIRNGHDSSIQALYELVCHVFSARNPEEHLQPALRPAAAILYDQDCSGGARTDTKDRGPPARLTIPNMTRVDYWDAHNSLMAHILTTDYGTGDSHRAAVSRTYHDAVVDLLDEFSAFLTDFAVEFWRGRPPDAETWKYLSRVLYEPLSAWRALNDVADFSPMLYHLQTRWRPGVTPSERLA